LTARVAKDTLPLAMENKENEQNPVNQPAPAVNVSRVSGMKTIQPTSTEAVAATTPVRPATQSIYPDATRDIRHPLPAAAPAVDLAGTSYTSHGVDMSNEPKASTLVGVYVIGVFVILGGVLDWISAVNGRFLFLGIASAQIVLGACIMFRFNLARRILIILSVVSVILWSFSIVDLHRSQQQIVASMNKFNQIVENYGKQGKLSTPSGQKILIVQKQLTELEKVAEDRIQKAYIATGFSILLAIGLIYFLRRPRVKKLFE